MLDVMYDIPSLKDVKEVIINDQAVQRKEPPLVVMMDDDGETNAEPLGSV